MIFGQGKTAEQIEAILRTLLEHEQGGLVTRVDPAAAAHLETVFPEGEHNALGRTFRIAGPARPTGRSSAGWSSSRRGPATCRSPRRRG